MILRHSCTKLRLAMKDVNEALKQHGFVANIGRITYTSDEMRMKFRVTEVGAKAKPAVSEATQFAMLAPVYGFAASDYKRQVRVMGIAKPVTLIGFKPKSKKYPIVIQTVTGKKYKVQKHNVSFI